MRQWHAAATPVGHPPGFRWQGRWHQGIDFLRRIGRLAAASRSNLPKALRALLGKTGAPQGHGLAIGAQLPGNGALRVALGRRHKLSAEGEAAIVDQLAALPRQVEAVLALDPAILQLAERFTTKQHALFLGRGVQYPVAMEGALKLKEISYIHAEAYPAGELKHGPLALVDEEMPVIAVAPNDELLEKLKSNLEEVRARGGELYVFADHASGLNGSERVHVTVLPAAGDHVTPIIFTIPLQLLAYHVAVLRGTDVDQPRNLAKSVTVE